MQPIGQRYSKNQIDNRNTNTFETISSPVREEVGEFRDGCFVLDDSSAARPANCIELARPKLKSTAKDLKIRDFKDGYFELRKDGAAAPAAQPGTGDVRSASAPVLLTPDHFRSQSSTQHSSALYSSQQTKPSAAQPPLQPPHQAAQHPLHQFSAPRLQTMPVPVHTRPLAVPMPSSSVPTTMMFYHQHAAQQQHWLQRQQQQQQQLQKQLQQQHQQQHLQAPPAVNPAPFSFQSFAQGVAASQFRPPPINQVVHANDLAMARASATQPLLIPAKPKARGKSPEKRRSTSPPVVHAKWAGGGYSNSPHPSLLPAPVF